jgi:hypothetical protein
MLCDVDQENSVEHIWQCLDEIGVERVDHGLNAVEDRALGTEINRRGLGLTLRQWRQLGAVRRPRKEVERILSRCVTMWLSSAAAPQAA